MCRFGPKITRDTRHYTRIPGSGRNAGWPRSLLPNLFNGAPSKLRVLFMDANADRIAGMIYERLAMKITRPLFEAHVKCTMKCWLRSIDEPACSDPGSLYAKWIHNKNEMYRAGSVERLMRETPPEKYVAAIGLENIRSAKWQFAFDVEAHTSVLEVRLDAVERISAGRGQATQFVPLRFLFANKLTKDDKVSVAFDALALSQIVGRDIRQGKLVHGDNHSCSTIDVSALAGEVRGRIGKITSLLSSASPPDLVLNRHCAECEFRSRCRQRAEEQDDLSLLSSITPPERKKLNGRGVFTVKQLSYAFLPRRPKRLQHKPEKYHSSLKALALREKKIHVVGKPELNFEGTPVFIDVEGVPDRDFYYLIGLRVLGDESSPVQHSLWADRLEDEAKIYAKLLELLKGIHKPTLFHYGRFETVFFEQMGERYGETLQAALATNETPTDLLSLIRGHIYFPTYSDSLKDVASWLGFAWTEPSPIGLNSIIHRDIWENSRNAAVKADLLTYNAEDCHAAEIVARGLLGLQASEPKAAFAAISSDSVDVESLRKKRGRFGPFLSPFKEFEKIALAARWDYQRDRIRVRSISPTKARVRTAREYLSPRNRLRTNKTIVHPTLSSCPTCGRECKIRSRCTRMGYDLCFGKSSVKRWIVKHHFHYCWCNSCKKRFGEPPQLWPQSHFGRDLVAYVLYHTIELAIPFPTVKRMLSACFKLDILLRTLVTIKTTAAKQYQSTYDGILGRVLTGNLLHIDETHVSVGGKPAYVWVLTNLFDVVYLYTEGREGAFLQEMLKDFRGVLVSDFYAAYDSIGCAQQKCLIHLIRDLNDDVLKHPFDEELKGIVRNFAALLKPIIQTIDHRGLKRRFLAKHRVEIDRFYRDLSKHDYQSERAQKCKKRFEKNRDKLFTFLSYDGVPWNNNNAEHAVKAFAKIRDIVRGTFTARTVRINLVLLSICQTCKYSGVSFFDFMRSGELDLYAFLQRKGCQRV
jgi:predicted RecB family nuclease